MTQPGILAQRGRKWFAALAGESQICAGMPGSILVADSMIQHERVRYMAVVPDPQGRFPRARAGQVGIDEGWALAHAVREAMMADREGARCALVAIVALPSQAYGRREETLGLHLALAAATDAYASARFAGHPVVALIVGHAQSGGFLAHGYQANCILALDDPDVTIHAMSKQATARITKRTLAEMEQFAAQVLPMAYDLRSYARLGVLDTLIEGVNTNDPRRDDVEHVKAMLLAAIADARTRPRDLSHRWTSAAAQQTRRASIEVRRRMAQTWD